MMLRRCNKIAEHNFVAAMVPNQINADVLLTTQENCREKQRSLFLGFRYYSLSYFADTAVLTNGQKKNPTTFVCFSRAEKKCTICSKGKMRSSGQKEGETKTAK